MDPTACLERLLEAYGTDDRDEIAAAADDLLRWIGGGGFLPGSRKYDTEERAELTEPQLSALLIMARGYARADCPIAHAL